MMKLLKIFKFLANFIGLDAIWTPLAQVVAGATGGITKVILEERNAPRGTKVFSAGARRLPDIYDVIRAQRMRGAAKKAAHGSDAWDARSSS